MRTYRWTIVLILSFILFPITINGEVCPNSDKVIYQSLAKNISVSYDNVEENENAYFNATFTNIPEGFYLKNLDTKKIYECVDSEMVISGLEQGKKYRFGVYSSLSGCNDTLLYTYYATLPYYNPYYNDQLCSGIENFKYCSKWVNKKITYDEFKENIEKYLKKNETAPKEEENNDSNLFNVIIDIYLKYYIFVLPAVIILGIVIIKKYNKKQDLF